MFERSGQKLNRGSTHIAFENHVTINHDHKAYKQNEVRTAFGMCVIVVSVRFAFERC